MDSPQTVNSYYATDVAKKIGGSEMNKKIVGLGLATIAALSLVACGSRTAKKDTASSSDVKAAIITDIGGVTKFQVEISHP